MERTEYTSSPNPQIYQTAVIKFVSLIGWDVDMHNKLNLSSLYKTSEYSMLYQNCFKLATYRYAYNNEKHVFKIVNLKLD